MAWSRDPYDLKAQHTPEEYKEALKRCRPLLRGTKYLDLLRAHYRAPDHTITAGELAEAVGYAGWTAANLQYGRFAGAIAEKLGYRRGQLEGVGVANTPDVAVLVAFGGGGPIGEHITWRLLPPVVRALEDMRWVRKEER